MDRKLATYYAVSPIPSDWTPEQVDSFLREYNTRMLHLLTIHEAMPGHYVEGAHSNKHPSLLRAVLRSGPFAEGWAVYAENMVADADGPAAVAAIGDLAAYGVARFAPEVARVTSAPFSPRERRSSSCWIWTTSGDGRRTGRAVAQDVRTTVTVKARANRTALGRSAPPVSSEDFLL